MSKRKQQQQQDLNVLVLGNSNTGKSTLINYFVNYHQDIDSSVSCFAFIYLFFFVKKIFVEI